MVEKIGSLGLEKKDFQEFLVLQKLFLVSGSNWFLKIRIKMESWVFENWSQQVYLCLKTKIRK